MLFLFLWGLVDHPPPLGYETVEKLIYGTWDSNYLKIFIYVKVLITVCAFLNNIKKYTLFLSIDDKIYLIIKLLQTC